MSVSDFSITFLNHMLLKSILGYTPLIRLLGHTYPENRAKDFRLCVV